MRTFSINQKPNGQHLRVTVEHKPLQVPQLIDLQNTIKSRFLEFTPKDKEYIHLTLLHLGIPQDIFYEIRKFNPDLTQDSFAPRLNELLLGLYTYTQLNQIQIEVIAEKIKLYGSSKSPAVALKIVRNPEIDQLHSGAYQILVDWVKSLMIVDPGSFIQSSRNFRHAPPQVFDPHITLGRIPTISTKLPKLDQMLKLTIDKPYLAHVTVM